MSVLFLKIVNMSISASWLVLAVLALRLCLKRAPKWVNVLLWGLVAARLMLPVSIESAWSLLPRTETVRPAAAAAPVQSGAAAVIGGTAVVSGTEAPLSGWTVLAWVWLAGVLALLLYTALSTLRLRQKVSEAVRLRGNIYETERIASPFVLGVLCSKIYLPYRMDSRDRQHVIAHEQAHLRRGDHVWKPLGFLLLTVHWFNPLMWFSYVLLCRDIELACDEKVIKDLGREQRADYMQALVSCSVNRRRIAACPLAFGEIGVKERVKSVMLYKKPTFWIILLAVAACIVLAVCFLTDPAVFRYDAAADPIVSANHFDMRNHTDPVAIEMTPAQLSELSSRLAGVKNCRRSDQYAGWTPGYQISALLQDGTYIRINGYNSSDNTWTDIERGGVHYVVSDSDFQNYLSAICAGTDVANAEPAADPAAAAPEEPVQPEAPSEPEQPTEQDMLQDNLSAEQDALKDDPSAAGDYDPVLDTAIGKAVLEHYADSKQTGQYQAESHVTLAKDESSDGTLTVYLLVLQQTYSVDGESLTVENGSYVPTAITFSLATSSGPALLEYWEPRNGSYSDDIRAKFPPAAAEEALQNDQAYIDDLRGTCEQAVRAAIHGTEQ